MIHQWTSFEIWLIGSIFALREEQDGAGLQYFICNPRKSPAEVLLLFIDLSLLFQLKCRANRGLGRIPPDRSIPYPTHRPAAKQLYLGYWWTQTKHLFHPPPLFLLCLSVSQQSHFPTQAGKIFFSTSWYKELTFGVVSGFITSALCGHIFSCSCISSLWLSLATRQLLLEIWSFQFVCSQPCTLAVGVVVQEKLKELLLFFCIVSIYIYSYAPFSSSLLYHMIQHNTSPPGNDRYFRHLIYWLCKCNQVMYNLLS